MQDLSERNPAFETTTDACALEFYFKLQLFRCLVHTFTYLHIELGMSILNFDCKICNFLYYNFSDLFL